MYRRGRVPGGGRARGTRHTLSQWGRRLRQGHRFCGRRDPGFCDHRRAGGAALGGFRGGRAGGNSADRSAKTCDAGRLACSGLSWASSAVGCPLSMWKACKRWASRKTYRCSFPSTTGGDKMRPSALRNPHPTALPEESSGSPCEDLVADGISCHSPTQTPLFLRVPNAWRTPAQTQVSSRILMRLDRRSPARPAHALQRDRRRSDRPGRPHFPVGISFKDIVSRITDGQHAQYLLNR